MQIHTDTHRSSLLFILILPVSVSSSPVVFICTFFHQKSIGDLNKSETCLSPNSEPVMDERPTWKKDRAENVNFEGEDDNDEYHYVYEDEDEDQESEEKKGKKEKATIVKIQDSDMSLQEIKGW